MAHFENVPQVLNVHFKIIYNVSRSIFSSYGLPASPGHTCPMLPPGTGALNVFSLSSSKTTHCVWAPYTLATTC